MSAEVKVCDCRDGLRGLADGSVDAIVTDPPYELTANKKGGSGLASVNLDSPYGRARIGTGNGGGFMGQKWDATGIAHDKDFWRECLRVLKPGGHLLAFGGTRTYHRMTCAIEDAGFEIRDSLHWIYGSGFPKSKNVALSIDKGEGFSNRGRAIPTASTFQACDLDRKNKLTSNPVPEYEARSDAAKEWQGWGTALKPAHEPIVVARKPLVGTVAANVLEYGTGSLNIDETRVASDGSHFRLTVKGRTGGFVVEGDEREGAALGMFAPGKSFEPTNHLGGRWPPNVLLSHSPECNDECAEDCAVAEMDRQGDSAKFFPCFHYGAKAGRKEREAGCENLPPRSGAQAVEREEGSDGMNSPRAGAGRTASEVRNHHPTVKPVEVMRWLVRLVTPLSGLVLDPFAGSGTTGVACVHEGFDFVGFEQSPEYAAIAEARIVHAKRER